MAMRPPSSAGLGPIPRPMTRASAPGGPLAPVQGMPGMPPRGAPMPLPSGPRPPMPGGPMAPMAGAGPMGVPMGGAPPMTASGARPGTGAQGGMRPGSGLKRQGTAGGVSFAPPTAGGGVSLNTKVQVEDRPVTRQGMMGMKMGKDGPGRQVQDKSFYMGELRGRMSELGAEIERLRAEEEKLAQDSTKTQQLVKKDESMKKELNTLRGQLADYNLVVDKNTMGLKLEDMKRDRDGLKSQNERERKRVDAIFTERSGKEQKIREVEDKIRLLQQDMDAKMNAEPDKRDQYIALREENTRLQEEIVRRQSEMEDLQRKVKMAEQDFQSDPALARALALDDQRRQLERKKEELENTLQQSKGENGQDEKTRLLAQVKKDNAEIAEKQRQIDQESDAIAQLKHKLKALVMDLAESKATDKADKYQELMQKDQEMQEFIEKFDQTKKDELEAISRTEENIVHLLEHISRGMTAQENMPTPQRLAEMKEDLAFKDRQMDFSQTTLERLRGELDLRKKEFEKINTLDTKIAAELKMLAEKSTTMKDDLVKYSNVDALRDESEARKKLLATKKSQLSKQKDSLKQHIHLLSSKHEETKRKLASDDIHNTLDGLEQKIRVYEQNNFGLRDFIEGKTSEINYNPVKDEVAAITKELNDLIIKSVANA